jgi:hypothetical protein
LLIESTERLTELANDLRASSYTRQDDFECLGPRRIHFVDLVEFTCNLLIADRINEVAALWPPPRARWSNRRSFAKIEDY